MKKLLKVLTLLLALVYAPNQAHSQGIKNLGVSINYNYAIKNSGVGLRYYVPLNQRLNLVPQIRYQPSFNEIHESYAGVLIHYSIYVKSILDVYLLGGGEVNYWFNYTPSANPKAKQVNFLPELGCGVQIPLDKFMIFSELKYNPVWQESFSELGLRFTPNVKRKNKQLKCPKF